MLPCTNKGIHEIKTGVVSVTKNPYAVSFALKDEMRTKLDDMTRRGVITPACSERVAHLRFVEMKSLIGVPKYKFCTDFGRLNAVKNSSLFHSRYYGKFIFDSGSRYFTLLDIESAYWYIHTYPAD
jgi:hypothetical protein